MCRIAVRPLIRASVGLPKIAPLNISRACLSHGLSQRNEDQNTTPTFSPLPQIVRDINAIELNLKKETSINFSQPMALKSAQSEETFAFATVTAIIERANKILIQVRKDEDPTYDNTLEMPTGKIRAGEIPTDALRREVQEEIGLEITKITDSRSSPIYNQNQDPSAAFTPFVCIWQQIAQKSWTGFAFRCQVESDKAPTLQSSEVRKIEWIKVSELQKIFKTEPKRINSFNLGILDYYFNHRKEHE